MLTSRFDEAFAYARLLHNGQKRKETQIPYVSHLMCVSGLVLENEGTEDQAIAALLHDAAEDQGGQKRLADIRLRFGDPVADIVADCTDTFAKQKGPWKPRKIAYLKSLPHKPKSSLLVSLADKTHNAEAIHCDWLTVGEKIWGRFSASADETLWYYRSLANVFLMTLPGPLANRLERTVSRLEKRYS